MHDSSVSIQPVLIDRLGLTFQSRPRSSGTAYSQLTPLSSKCPALTPSRPRAVDTQRLNPSSYSVLAKRLCSTDSWLCVWARTFAEQSRNYVKTRGRRKCSSHVSNQPRGLRTSSYASPLLLSPPPPPGRWWTGTFHKAFPCPTPMSLLPSPRCGPSCGFLTRLSLPLIRVEEGLDGR